MLHAIARAVRHAPILERLEPVWTAVRPLYLQALDPLGQGAKVRIGDHTVVRMPKDLVGGGDWSGYEAAETKRVAEWLAQQPGSVLVDVGCATGLYSLIGLSHGARVIALDADGQSLACTARFCKHEGRPELVWGFATEVGSGQGLDEATAIADQEASKYAGSDWAGTYVCIESGADVPSHALSDLLPRGQRTLIKADIEGAELLMLRGAEAFIRAERPEIALSVHPTLLPRHGHSVEMVRDFLAANDYLIDVFSIDHEEHWWCSPSAA